MMQLRSAYLWVAVGGGHSGGQQRRDELLRGAVLRRGLGLVAITAGGGLAEAELLLLDLQIAIGTTSVR